MSHRQRGSYVAVACAVPLMHVFEQHGGVEASVACRFVLRRRSAIGCGSSDACVRAASSSGSVCCLQVRAETKKRKAPAPVIPRALPLLQPGSADLVNSAWVHGFFRESARVVTPSEVFLIAYSFQIHFCRSTHKVVTLPICLVLPDPT